MDIFVNGRRVGETLAIPWEEKPSSVSIGVSCQARNMCGELDRFEIRELDKFASDNSKSGVDGEPREVKGPQVCRVNRGQWPDPSPGMERAGFRWPPAD